MSYIGNTNITQGFIPAIDYFSGTGSATAFTLSRPVASVAQVQVTIDNVAQNPSSAFTVSSNTITFTSAPLSGTNNIYVYYTSPITQVIAPGQGTVTATSMASSTGTGAGVFQTSPTITTPTIDTITSAASTALTLKSAGTTAITVDASQNVGIGTASPVFKVDIQAASSLSAQVKNTSGSGYAQWKATSPTTTLNAGADNVGGFIETIGAYPTLFYTNSTERMRITSGGNLLVGATSGVGSEKINVTQTASDWVGQFVNNNATQAYCIRASTGTYYFNTSSLLYDGLDFGNLRFRVYTNGGIANYSANNSNLSDQREKKDIELAPNYLNKICQIPVKTFFYNQQTDTEKNLGAIAQDVQAICPELVTESNWGTEEEPKMRLSIYQTDLQYALMKSIQELKAINDTQAETINALTARIEALENR